MLDLKFKELLKANEAEYQRMISQAFLKMQQNAPKVHTYPSCICRTPKEISLLKVARNKISSSLIQLSRLLHCH